MPVGLQNQPASFQYITNRLHLKVNTDMSSPQPWDDAAGQCSPPSRLVVQGEGTGGR